MKRLLYRWFRAASSFQHRLDRRFTRAGWLALGVVGAAAVIGLDTNRTVGHQVFTLVLALLAFSTAAGFAFPARLPAPRILPPLASVGVTPTDRVAVRK